MLLDMLSRRRLSPIGSTILALWLCGCSKSSEPPRDAPARTLASATPPSAPLAPPSPSARAASSTAAPLPPALQGGGEKAVQSELGLVTCSEGNATRAGVRILEQGGNAVDAAIATAFALAVTHSSAGNVGGGGFALIRPPAGPTVALDFRETAPAALTQAKFDAMIKGGARGAQAAGVPGTVRGLWLAHQRFGKLPWPALVEPAIELARSGFVLAERQSKLIAWSLGALKADPVARSLFTDGGKAKKPGARVVQPDLARTLERIRDRGPSGFYEGETAQALTRAPGSLLSADDLSRYAAKVREPLRFSYRGYTVETMPPPSGGGVVLAQILLMLDALGAAELPADSPDELHLFVEASKRAHTERRFAVVDPDDLEPSALRAKIERWLDPNGLLSSMPIDRAAATPSSKLHPLYAAALRELEHTTHLSVADRDGMVVSLTTTLSASFGAKIVVPGTGIVLNNAVASFATAGENLPVAGRRTVSSMAPTLVLRGEDVVLVLGTPGGDTIPGTIAQILRRLIDHRSPLDAAIDAPRIHQGFVPDQVSFERDRPPAKALLEGLRARGHVVKQGRGAIGDANNLLLEGGKVFGYADPRGGGLALGATRSAERGH